MSFEVNKFISFDLGRLASRQSFLLSWLEKSSHISFSPSMHLCNLHHSALICEESEG